MRPGRNIELTEHGKAYLAGQLDRDSHPRAYTGPFPILSHPSLAEVVTRKQPQP